MHNCIVFNAEAAYYFKSDSTYRRFVEEADFLFCDSISLSLVLRIIGVEHRRLHGPDFMEFLLLNNVDKRIYILGGNATAHSNIKRKFNLNDFYSNHDNIGPDSVDEICNQISGIKPDLILICLGLYKQEKIAYQIVNHIGNESSLNNTLIVGCGAAVDFLGGTKLRAGSLWRKCGLEWLPRLFREPRMAKRLLRSAYGCILMLFLSADQRKSINKFRMNFYDVAK